MNEPTTGVRIARSPARSRVEMTEIVLPAHTNRFGTVFGGQIMSWVDIAGAVASQRHAESLVVTAAIDQVHFIHGARMGDVITLHAQVNYAGRTSMEVGVRVTSENPVAGICHHTATAYLTFVAVDEHGKPQPVPPVEPVTDDDRRRYEAAEQRRLQRLEARQKAVERSQRSSRRLRPDESS